MGAAASVRVAVCALSLCGGAAREVPLQVAAARCLFQLEFWSVRVGVSLQGSAGRRSQMFMAVCQLECGCRCHDCHAAHKNVCHTYLLLSRVYAGVNLGEGSGSKENRVIFHPLLVTRASLFLVTRASLLLVTRASA